MVIHGRQAEAMMMGQQIAKREQLTAFSVEDYVPDEHLLRRIDHFHDLAQLREQLAPFYSVVAQT